MSLYAKLREKAAQKVSSLGNAETFNWNKWLRAPSNEEKEIKRLYSDLINTDFIILFFDLPSSSFFDPKIAKVKSIKSSSKAFRIKSKTNPIFFQFGITRSINYDISFRQELKQYFSSEIIHDKSSVQMKIKNYKQKEVSKQLSGISRDIPFPFAYSTGYMEYESLTNRKLNFEFSTNASEAFETEIFTYRTTDIEYTINTPLVVDYLTKLIPKIYKISLLNSFEDIISQGRNYQIKMDLLDSLPTIVKESDLELFPDAILSLKFDNKIRSKLNEKNYLEKLTPYNNYKSKSYFPEFIGQQDILFSMFYNSDSTQPVITRSYDSEWVEEMNNNLQPIINLSIEEENEIFKPLYPYQIEGAKFLIDNQTACLADEIGLGKTLEAISAIKYLIKKKEIKNVLILTQKYSLIEKGFNKDIGVIDGWEEHFQKFAPEIKTIIINSDRTELNDKLKQNAQIFFINYELIFESLITNSIDFNSLKKFDCICFDDAEILINYLNNIEKLLKLSNSKYTWLLSNQPDYIFQEKSLLKICSNASLGRNKDQIANQVSKIIKQEFWIGLDKEQRLEYDQAYSESQSQIWNVLKTGNPYRLQAIVFTLLHKLKQITNYAFQKLTSNKTNLLLLQLKSIKSFNHKVIVISQYDKFGTQRLIELFKQNEIKYAAYLPGGDSNELQQSVTNFKNDKTITALLLPAKESINIVQQVKSNYVIYFDQWWMPVASWQLEDKIQQQNIQTHIISYYTKDTIEEKIRIKLLEMDLLSRDNVGNIGADAYSKLLNEKDWLEIFNVPNLPIEPEKPSEDAVSDL